MMVAYMVPSVYDDSRQKNGFEWRIEIEVDKQMGSKNARLKRRQKARKEAARKLSYAQAKETQALRDSELQNANMEYDRNKRNDRETKAESRAQRKSEQAQQDMEKVQEASRAAMENGASGPDSNDFVNRHTLVTKVVVITLVVAMFLAVCITGFYATN